MICDPTGPQNKWIGVDLLDTLGMIADNAILYVKRSLASLILYYASILEHAILATWFYCSLGLSWVWLQGIRAVVLRLGNSRSAYRRL